MSYRLAQTPRILSPQARHPRGGIGPHLLGSPTVYHPSAIVPLAEAPPLAPAMSESTKRLLLLFVVVVGILAFLWWLSQRRSPKANAPASVRKEALARVSTPELAKRLYERLDSKGKGGPEFMRSLQRYAKKT